MNERAANAGALLHAARQLPGELVFIALQTNGRQESARPRGVLLAFGLEVRAKRLDDLERQAILEALRLNTWVQKDAAKFLGISSRVMNYKVAKYEIKNARWTKNRQVG